MLVKGVFVMFKVDKLTTFHSSFKNGAIELLRCSCPFNDAIELANTPLLERD